MGYNHNLYISISDVSSTGFRVNATFVAGQNSYNAQGFTVNTDVDGFSTRYHTAYISSRGGSDSWSDYYSVSEDGLRDRVYNCSAWADTSWSSNGCDSGNPVRTSVTVPKRAYVGHPRAQPTMVSLLPSLGAKALRRATRTSTDLNCGEGTRSFIQVAR